MHVWWKQVTEAKCDQRCYTFCAQSFSLCITIACTLKAKQVGECLNPKIAQLLVQARQIKMETGLGRGRTCGAIMTGGAQIATSGSIHTACSCEDAACIQELLRAGAFARRSSRNPKLMLTCQECTPRQKAVGYGEAAFTCNRHHCYVTPACTLAMHMSLPRIELHTSPPQHSVDLQWPVSYENLGYLRHCSHVPLWHELT